MKEKKTTSSEQRGRGGRPLAGGNSKSRAGKSHDEIGPGHGNFDPKWRWQYRVLNALREQLLRGRGEQLRQAAEPLEIHSLHLGDSATDEFDHNMALARLTKEQNALYEVEAAIGRIVAGTYGYCEETGKPIPAARLRAVPWTRFSKGVEARLEGDGTVARPRLGKVGSVHEAIVDGFSEAAEGEEDAGTQDADDEKLGQTFIAPGKHIHPSRKAVRKRIGK